MPKQKSENQSGVALVEGLLESNLCMSNDHKPLKSLQVYHLKARLMLVNAKMKRCNLRGKEAQKIQGVREKIVFQ